MNHLGYRWKTFATVAPILGLASALSIHAQSLPDGPGKATFQRTCSACHSLTVVTSRRLSASGWENVVDNMVSRGASGTPDELKEIVRYLTASFGAADLQSSAPEGNTAEVAPVHPHMPPAPVLDSSQTARAKELIKVNGCLSCHRMDGDGSFAGPYLGDVGANHGAEDIRASLVSPKKTLTPQNRSVRLVTQDGKTVAGKLLNQDGFSVQLIDASGHLLSFDRANLRGFTIITENSMPSYTNRIAPQDLSLIINYLTTLTGPTQQQ